MESRVGAPSGAIVVQAGQALPAGAVQLGDRAIVDVGNGQHLCLKQIDANLVGSMEAEDLRVLPLRFDPQGQRRAEFADMVALMKQVDMPGWKDISNFVTSKIRHAVYGFPNLKSKVWAGEVGVGLEIEGSYGKPAMNHAARCPREVKSMVMRGLAPVTDHEHWVRTHELAKGDRSVYEMEVITRVLEALAAVDQLNLPNLKGAELLIRR